MGQGRAVEQFGSALYARRWHQCRLRTSNLAERVNEEIRRRQRVIRIFPNEASAERLIGAWLADLHDQWLAGCRYFDMKEFWDWVNEQKDKIQKNNFKLILSN